MTNSTPLPPRLVELEAVQCDTCGAIGTHFGTCPKADPQCIRELRKHVDAYPSKDATATKPTAPLEEPTPCPVCHDSLSQFCSRCGADSTELATYERWTIAELRNRDTGVNAVVGDLAPWVILQHIAALTTERDALAATVARVREVINAAGRTGVYLTPQQVRDALDGAL